ncbi:MAG: hypothetical protein QOI91_1049 [Solirubrobacteraceae bacterium]|jgi:hypothetical protein|nr:hypothetical protein [Solirubrobacteraceae bacterium]
MAVHRRFVPAVLVAAVMLVPASSSAATFCVQTASCAGGTMEPDLQAALSAAAGVSGRDRIEIGATTLTPAQVDPADFEADDFAGNPVDIVGAGRTQTTIVRSPGGVPNSYALYIEEPSSTVQDLQVELPTSAARWGIDLVGATATRIGITSGSTTQIGYYGVQMSGPATLADSQVATPDTTFSVGAFVQDTTAGATISNTTFTGGSAISQNHGTLAVRRIRATVTLFGIAVYGNGSLDVQDSTIHVTPPASPPFGASALWAAGQSGTDNSTMTARHVTIDGNSTPDSVGAFTNASGAGQSASITVRDSIIRDVGHALSSNADPGATTSISTDYSDYDNSGNLVTGGGSIPSETNRLNVDPQFVNAAAGDFRLSAGSPVVDAGMPGGLGAGELTTDLAGSPRLLDGNGDCGVRRDIGAFEFSPSTLSASATASADRAQTGVPITFTGSIPCDPDPAATLSYSWSFDDGTGAAGPSVPKAFTIAGAHVATLTVTDSAGRAGTATRAVTINNPPATSTPTPTDRTAPTLTRFRLTPSSFRAARSGASIAAVRTGATVSYVVSEASTTTFKVERALPGIKRGRSCIKRPRGSRGGSRCTRFVPVRGSFSHRDAAGADRFRFTGRLGGRALAPGDYRLGATPRDAASNVGRTIRSTFHILR